MITGGGCGSVVLKVMKGLSGENRVLSRYQWKAFRWCTNGLPLVNHLEKLTDDDTYILIFGNNTELRPTGGFMGSYAKITFKNGVMKEMRVHDIYQPDGQLPGHVEPPYPVQESFRQGWWKLRDANWKIDYRKAAQDIGWFLEQGGEERIDGIITVNLGTVNGLIGILEPVQVRTYDATVTRENFYQLAQSEAEVGFKPGSTQKRDFLGAAGVALWEKTKSAKPAEIFKIIKLIKSELDDGQVLVWIKDTEAQKEAELWKWGGDLGFRHGLDYLYIVETNLGANKANCCIRRKVNQEINNLSQSSSLRNTIKTEWANSGQYPSPRPPEFWGGDYFNYVRTVVPRNTGIKRIRIEDGVGERILRESVPADFASPNSLRQERSYDMYHTEDVEEDLKSVGFWVRVNAGSTASAELELESQAEDKNSYSVLVKRQPGIEGFDYQLTVNGKIEVRDRVERDREFTVALW